MFANFTEPVFGVGKILLATVHGSMPVTTARGVDGLTDGMRLVQKIVPQPKSRVAAVGHVLVNDCLADEQVCDGQVGQQCAGIFVWTPWPQVVESLRVNEFRDRGAVLARSEI